MIRIHTTQDQESTQGGEPPALEGDWDWAGARRQCLREARRLLRHDEDAEEAVQEALARAWRRRATCQSPEAPQAWLARIARNEALRVLARRNARCEREISETVSGEPAGEDRSLDDVLGEIATEQALAGLSRDERRLIDLRYMQDLTQPDVAERLALPEGTVKVRLHRLRRRLETEFAYAA